MLRYPPTGAALPTDLRPGGRFDEWSPQRPAYVVLDVDGTLLGLTGSATTAVVDAARVGRQAGLHLGLATGRMPRACTALAAEVGLTGPHVVHNGAEVVLDDGQPLRRWPLGRPAVDALLDLCVEHDVYVELYIDDGFWVNDRRAAAQAHWDLLGAGPEGDARDADLDRVLKATVLLFGDEDEAALLASLAAAGLGGGPAHAPTMPGVTFVNVTAAAADKGVGVAAAAEHLGCSIDAVVAVGDGLNDLSMLAVAGTAVAMGQSSEEVRAAAHLVVPEVDADGVAHALRAAATWAGA
jgi:Cof subfamily protein (haloacid dehalogenase superfamily)